ncbi:hypothetical protein CH63R_00436 [Colletotrichum higginsianum IMI 349063]|uniref:Uncharacterized protein n=1 Tax=Colletotrichum higginsianum (strain IMI 349063) TaxID=759273 RepID=A0A1B7YT78_COLHI|nr:hypothetical protein CH63R_00436 [Colletotrichum higginsianum IMI 349063]OBR15256.1 hypothetical protein CH63R_00436 [Colletotrichum higginsianum IMI 349063]
MLSSRLLAALGLFGLVAASPQIQVAPSNAADCPRTMCLDGINPESAPEADDAAVQVHAEQIDRLQDTAAASHPDEVSEA